MKALLIIAMILLLLLFLSSLYAKLRVKYEKEELTVWIGILFFRFQVFPGKEKKEKKPKLKSKGKKAEATTSPRKKKKKTKTKEEIKELLTGLYDLLRAVIRPTGFVLRHARIDDLDLQIVVGGEEPDETAIAYGRWNAAVYGGLATLRNFMKIKCNRLVLAVDFTQLETEVAFSATFKIRIWALLVTVIRMIWRFLVNTLRKDEEAVLQTA